MEQTSIDVLPLISHNKESCTECWGCVRCCPVRAIRVIGDRSEVVQEKCVACGLCVAECGRGGHIVRDDVPSVRALLQSHRRVIALLASEFIPALHPMTVSQIEAGLAALGFWSVETTLLGEEIVAAAYSNVHLRGSSLLSIRSTCPVTVDFVRKYYPALVPALAPIVPPYIAQARLIREVYANDDHAIVYVSPCYARKDEFRDPEFGGVVDAVIDFGELRRMLESGDRIRPNPHRSERGAVRPGVLKEISLTDGFPRETLAARDQTDASVHVARGLPELDRLLRAVIAGEAGPTIIDMLNCEGCIDGPTVNPGLSLFAKRNIEAAARDHSAATQVSTKAILAVLPAVEVVRSFSPAPVIVDEPTPRQIDEMLVAGRFTRETALDCGACGWPTCVEHAAAVYRTESSWDLCLPLQRIIYSEQRDQLDSHRSALEEAQTLDPLTGLWNRRAFSDRLNVEIARFQRYGSPLSIALVDVDGLGAVNELLGRDGGDQLLAALAARISSSLRITDFASRWVGDQFALILPGIGKTPAFAVGEKLRAGVREVAFVLDGDGYTRDVVVTVSVGVASASADLDDARALLEAADGALHEAMDAGRDRVHLAPG